VLFVLEATAGGTRRHLFEILSRLPMETFEPIVACAIGRDRSFAEDIREFRCKGIPVHVLPMVRPPSPYHDMMACWSLRRLVRRLDCNVIHLHSAKAGLLGRIAALGCDVPVIYSPHAFPFLQRGPIGWFADVAERVLAPRTDILLAVADAEGRLAIEKRLIDSTKLRVLPNAVDVASELERAGRLEPIRAPNDNRCFVFLGELRQQKAPMLFLEAASLALKRQPSMRFVLPARGPLLRKAREFVNDRFIQERISFVDAAESLKECQRGMDVGVLSSDYEGLPYAMLDALARQRPVLGSDIGVFRDTLGHLDERLLFRRGDATDLADKLELWSKLPTSELAQVGATGRSLVEQHHSPKQWIDQLCRIYRGAAGRT